MGPYGGEDDDNESVNSFSVMGDDEYIVSRIDQLRDDIQSRLQRRPRKINILVIGPAGVGKSAFITSLATALSGHFHEYSLSGHHGGETRPITFFMKRFKECCLDEEYKKRFSGAELPTLVDMAGMPNDSNHAVYEEILRTVLYGRLPVDMSIAQAEEVLMQDGIKELRTRCPYSNPDLKIHRILFVTSATEEALSQELIKCVVNTCRPSGTSSNAKTRAIPLYGVMTKIDKVDVSSDEYKAHEKKFQEALGIRGSSNRFVMCKNYCDDTAPDRSEINSPSLDRTFLRFFKELLDPFINVDFDEELEDFTELLPPPPILPKVNQIDQLFGNLNDFVGQIRHQPVPLVAGLLGLLFLLTWVFFSGPNVNMQGLRTTCIRMKDMDSHGSFRDLPELADVCKSLDSGFRVDILLLPVGTLLLAYAIYVTLKHQRASVNAN